MPHSSGSHFMTGTQGSISKRQGLSPSALTAEDCLGGKSSPLAALDIQEPKTELGPIHQPENRPSSKVWGPGRLEWFWPALSHPQLYLPWMALHGMIWPSRRGFVWELVDEVPLGCLYLKEGRREMDPKDCNTAKLEILGNLYSILAAPSPVLLGSSKKQTNKIRAVWKSVFTTIIQNWV